MLSASARLLRLLALLAARPSWTCAELAERMAVTDRTVRRDVARLRELGYTVDSGAGPWGGYRLRAGSRVPPLILDDEEALAVAVGLREAAFGGALGGDQAALSALLKLRQVLPPRIADRLGEWDDALVRLPGPRNHGCGPACCWSWQPPAGAVSGPGCRTATGRTGTRSGTSIRTGSSTPAGAGTSSPGT
ncbi:helix-turn-helix transcriptional regulator [Streptomyces flaveolus]|uniref:HTH domain-containing protein n=1 Tax=Streptomyces flaveolus TaxID=67297 RepID=A0ABV3ANQ5_9ACTN